MKVLFHTHTLNYRGVAGAVRDYARYNQEILGNESIILYNSHHKYVKDEGNEQSVVDKFKEEFKVIGYNGDHAFKEVSNICEKENLDLAYFIKAGNKGTELPCDAFDMKVISTAKTAVHCVFQAFEPHGDRYAYISEWLSRHVHSITKQAVPYVPHIVKLPEPTKNYREMLGVRPDQFLIGRIGGYYTFDIEFVKKQIEYLVSKTDRFVFLFIGTAPWIDHPNVKFTQEIHDVQLKTDLINSCDAGIHARTRGESFGLSIAEFLYLNKPILAFNGGHDLNHLLMLNNSGLLYEESNLIDKIQELPSMTNTEWSKRVKSFSPEIVMKKFKDVFL